MKRYDLWIKYDWNLNASIERVCRADGEFVLFADHEADAAAKRAALADDVQHYKQCLKDQEQWARNEIEGLKAQLRVHIQARVNLQSQLSASQAKLRNAIDIGDKLSKDLSESDARLAASQAEARRLQFIIDAMVAAGKVHQSAVDHAALIAKSALAPPQQEKP